MIACGPPGSLFGRNTQLEIVAKVVPNPLSQFGRKPTQDRVCYAVLVGRTSKLALDPSFLSEQHHRVPQEAMPIVDLGGTMQASVDECQCPACRVPACPQPGHEAPYGIRIMNINQH